MKALFLFAAVYAVPTPAVPSEGQGTNVRFVVRGLESNKGSVRCALFNSKEGFPTKIKFSVDRTASKIRDRSAACIFKNVKPGVYALAAYHDSNDDNELDTNFLGIPTEGTGVSNNAKGSFGPPKFKDAAFKVSDKKVAQSILINN